ncbi:hypothetical protein DFP72DRAFT_126228 [Ephemerocybe angulata]|uniref:Uncharacterized protein n=1 Tax=Ephemerocybe angulata TaxID=980116 RepID=A0A8H6LW63_9AGAR|nr:hypothetical protein DFP72DRAFT_126228 [Tulosesus angulatus]
MRLRLFAPLLTRLSTSNSIQFQVEQRTRTAHGSASILFHTTDASARSAYPTYYYPVRRFAGFRFDYYSWFRFRVRLHHSLSPSLFFFVVSVCLSVAFLDMRVFGLFDLAVDNVSFFVFPYIESFRYIFFLILVLVHTYSFCLDLLSWIFSLP